MKRSVGLLAKRVRQTPLLVRNYPGVYAALLASQTPWAPKELTYRMRNGYTIVSPNVDGARYPVYEIFADNGYHFDEFCAGLADDIGVLDIGGQVGCFSLGIAQAVKQCRVHVYEASPVSSSYVQRNVTANGLDQRVTVHAEAIAATQGAIAFLDSGTASGLNGLTAPEGHAHEVTVPGITFDMAVARMDGQVGVVKIDIEGGEYDAILSSTPASWDTVQRVVLEYHPVPGHSSAELEEFLAKVDLHRTRHERGDRPGLGMMWFARSA